MMIWKPSSTEVTRLSGRRKLHPWFIYRIVCTRSNFSTDPAIVSKIVRYHEIYSVYWFNSLLGALQFLGNLFEYFLVRRNKGKKGEGGLRAILLSLSFRQASVRYITISRQISFDGHWSNERRCKRFPLTKDLQENYWIHIDWICSDSWSSWQRRCDSIHLTSWRPYQPLSERPDDHCLGWKYPQSGGQGHIRRLSSKHWTKSRCRLTG